jgi:uncharacterized protein DUF5677
MTARSARRLRSMDEMKARVTGNIRTLNRRLVALAIRLDKQARSHEFASAIPGQLLTLFYRKTVNTARGIEVLKKEGLVEEAWILLRVLLESHVNFFYFLAELKDPEHAKAICQRYADATILDKLKHLREVSFHEGTPLAALYSRTEWEAAEDGIQARYPADAIKAMRKNGFTGLSFHDRAKAVGLKSMYESCYRIASRSVHMFDPAETSLYSKFGFKGRAEEGRELLRLRREQLEFNQNMLLGRPSLVVATIVDPIIEAQLIVLGVGYEKYRDRISGQNPGNPDDPPDSLRIWRV